MKKILCVITIMFLASGFTFAQQDPQDQQDRRDAPTDTAQQRLKEVSISKFEDAGYWKISISGDEGIAVARKMEGKPGAKKPLPDEEAIGITEREVDDYVLGVKTEFFHRGAATISIEPTRPINLAGIVKSVSVWVVGRNYNHVLKAMFRDFGGRMFELTFVPDGKLNHSGWKQLFVPIPDHINQRDAHYSTLTGIQFLGFKIECDMAETYGSYFVYFDEMRIVTDLFTEEDRDEDDMLDAW